MPFRPAYHSNMRRYELPGWFEDLLARNLGPPLLPEDLAPEIRRLSRLFLHGTGRRSPEHGSVPVYGWYFLTANVLKTASVLDEPYAGWADWLSGRDRLVVADLGSGPATASLGLVLALPAAFSPRIEIHLVEPNPDWLASGIRLLEDASRRCGIRAAVEGHRGTMEVKVGELPPADIIILGHVVNEIAAECYLQAARRLPDGARLVAIDSARREDARRMHAIRDRLLGAGLDLAILAPCTHGGPCPALQDPKGWCHEDRAWTRPPFFQRLDAAAGFNRSRLQYSFFVLERGGGRSSGGGPCGGECPAGEVTERWRVVGEVERLRGRFRTILCHPGGWTRVEHLRRRPSEFWNRLERGDIVSPADVPPEDRMAPLVSTDEHGPPPPEPRPRGSWDRP